MLQELLELNLFAFFLIFARVGVAFSLMPGFASGYLMMRARLSIALAVSFLLMPVLSAELPVLPESAVAMTLLIIGEIIVGSFFGLIARVLMGALQTAGTLIVFIWFS